MTSASGRYLRWAILGVLAFAPLPFGSTVAVIYLWETAVLAAIVGTYIIGPRVLDNGLVAQRAAPADLIVLVLFCVLMLWLCLQTIPLSLVGIGVAFLASGTQRVASTLSLAPGATLLMAARWGGFAAIFFLATRVSSRHAIGFLTVLAAVIGLYAAFALIELVYLGDTVLGVEKREYVGSATGPFVNRNSFAAFLSMGLIISGGLLQKQLLSIQGGWVREVLAPRNAVLLLLILVIGAALIATQSRMGVLSGVLGLVVALILGGQRGDRRWGSYIALFVVLAALSLLFGSGLVERLGSVEMGSRERLALYAQVAKMIQQRPLTGFGGGAFELAYPLFHALPVSSDVIFTRAHSTYMALWSELGLLFGSVPILMVLVVAWRASRSLSSGRRKGIAAIALGIVSAMGTHSLVDFSLEIPANALLFAAVLGLAFRSLPSPQSHGSSEILRDLK